MVRIVFILWMLFVSLGINAQGVNAFAIAKTNRNTVLVEQGLKVTVTVYTSTWFTKPLQIENLQVEGAFLQSFQRTLSSIQYVDKQQYATLEFYYIVFPYKDGELLFPELNIITETPPEGDYKGKRVTLKTKPIKINVEPIPKGSESEQWLVASSASISNKWNTDLKNLKVGDVLKRTITTKASGTLPSFIDEPLVKDVGFGNIYTSEAKYFDERDYKSVNGRRVDTYSYLLEEVGEFTIPEVEVNWYNPYARKYYKRKLPAYTILISENLDLAELVSLRDSLNALNPNLSDELLKAQEEVSYKQWIMLGVYLILSIFGILLVYRLLKRLVLSIKKRRFAYKNSEAYGFKNFLKQSDEQNTLITLYKWLDHSYSQLKNNTLRRFAKGDEALSVSLSQLKKNIYSAKTNVAVDIKNLKKDAARQRKQVLRKPTSDQTGSLLDDINP